MSDKPLQESSYERAFKIRKHLSQLTDTRPDSLYEVADDLARILRATDVSLALNDPTDNAAGMSLWYREFDPERLRAIARATGEHTPVRLLRRSGVRTTTFDGTGNPALQQIRGTDFFRRFHEESGYYRGIVSHLGLDRAESLGRLVFYRERSDAEFDYERTRLVEILQPALTRAARRVIAGRRTEPDSEVALINAGGQVLWMTDGFRFLWNTVDPGRFDYGTISIAEILAGSALGRAVAFRIILLEGPTDTWRGPERIVVAYRNSREGALEARFETVTDPLVGCRGSVLKLSLRPLHGEQVLSLDPDALRRESR